MSCLDIYIDGAAKGNPGSAGVGVIICRGQEIIRSLSRHIGNATNNVAEYSALIYALQEAFILKADKLRVWTDSELLCKQLRGEYKVRHDNLKPLYAQARHLISGLSGFEIHHISRDKNSAADKLASKAALDAKL